MGLLPQLSPSDVLVLNCPLCSFHSYLLNTIEEHFDEVHPDKIAEFIIYRCSHCQKVASCRRFMLEHITLLHTTTNNNNNTPDSPSATIGNNNTENNTNNNNNNDLQSITSSTISSLSIFFSGKLYSKNVASFNHTNNKCYDKDLNSNTSNSPSSCLNESITLSDLTTNNEMQDNCSKRNGLTSLQNGVLNRLTKAHSSFICIFCNSIHATFHNLQMHYKRHGIQNIDISSSNDEETEDNNCYMVQDKSNDDLNCSNQCRSNDTQSSSNPPQLVTPHSTPLDFLTAAAAAVSTPQNTSPLKTLTGHLQTRSSLFNLIMQQHHNSHPTSQLILSPPAAISYTSSPVQLTTPTTNHNEHLSDPSPLCLPPFNKVHPPRRNTPATPPASPWLTGNVNLSTLSQQLASVVPPHSTQQPPTITTNTTATLTAALHQQMMQAAYIAAQAAANSTPITSPSTTESHNSNNNNNSNISSSSDLFQMPKVFLPTTTNTPTMFSSGTDNNSMSIDLSASSTRIKHEKNIPNCDSDQRNGNNGGGHTLSPNDRNTISVHNHNQDSSLDSNTTDLSNNTKTSNQNSTTNNNNTPLDENQMYSMKRVGGLSRTNLPFNARKILFGWLTSHLREPYPSEEEKIRLANETGLSRTTVNNWFINARRRYVKPLIQGKIAMSSGVLKSMFESTTTSGGAVSLPTSSGSASSGGGGGGGSKRKVMSGGNSAAILEAYNNNNNNNMVITNCNKRRIIQNKETNNENLENKEIDENMKESEKHQQIETKLETATCFINNDNTTNTPNNCINSNTS